MGQHRPYRVDGLQDVRLCQPCHGAALSFNRRTEVQQSLIHSRAAATVTSDMLPNLARTSADASTHGCTHLACRAHQGPPAPQLEAQSSSPGTMLGSALAHPQLPASSHCERVRVDAVSIPFRLVTLKQTHQSLGQLLCQAPQLNRRANLSSNWRRLMHDSGTMCDWDGVSAGKSPDVLQAQAHSIAGDAGSPSVQPGKSSPSPAPLAPSPPARC